MVFKLAETVEKSWRRLDGHNLLPKLVLGVKFTDGIEIKSQLNSLPPDLARPRLGPPHNMLPCTRPGLRGRARHRGLISQGRVRFEFRYMLQTNNTSRASLTVE
jgi:hypothetical protein